MGACLESSSVEPTAKARARRQRVPLKEQRAQEERVGTCGDSCDIHVSPERERDDGQVFNAEPDSRTIRSGERVERSIA